MSESVVLKDLAFLGDSLSTISRSASVSSSVTSTSSFRSVAAETLIKAMEPLQVEYGDVVAKMGDAGQHFYIVSEGQVDFQVDGNVIGHAKKGMSFWDVNLLYNATNNATVVAASEDNMPTKLFRVDQTTYRGIMETKQAHSLERRATRKKSSSTLSLEGEVDGELSDILTRRNAVHRAVRSYIGLEKFERVSLLGEGQFGEVWLVQTEYQVSEDIGPETLQFALKCQKKNDTVRKASTEYAIKREMKTLQRLQHPFICDLVHTYEDPTTFYMLMGLVTGGELWDRIFREDETTGNWVSGLATEYEARFYALAIADTLAYLHSRRYVYRDLKPENVMIDGDGYPVLVDFGFAKRLKSESSITYTFCGTPNYVAPEIIRYAGHNAAADYWAFGCLVYEMLSGQNPFYYDGMETMDLFRAICENDYYAMDGNATASHDAQDLIDLLIGSIAKDPRYRLGMLKDKSKDVLEHEWFDGIDLEKLRRKELVAPWLPLSSRSTASAAESVPGDETETEIHSGDEFTEGDDRFCAESDDLDGDIEDEYYSGDEFAEDEYECDLEGDLDKEDSDDAGDEFAEEEYESDLEGDLDKEDSDDAEDNVVAVIEEVLKTGEEVVDNGSNNEGESAAAAAVAAAAAARRNKSNTIDWRYNRQKKGTGRNRMAVAGALGNIIGGLTDSFEERVIPRASAAKLLSPPPASSSLSKS